MADVLEDVTMLAQCIYEIQETWIGGRVQCANNPLDLQCKN